MDMKELRAQVKTLLARHHITLMEPGQELKPGEHYLGISGPALSGYFATDFWINNADEKDPFPEPWDTEACRWEKESEAVISMIMWAWDESRLVHLADHNLETAHKFLSEMDENGKVIYPEAG